MLLKPRPENIQEFAQWLRDAIAALEEVAAKEWDLSDYDYAARLVRVAEKHARYVGAQALCERCCEAPFRLHAQDAPLLSPNDGLTTLGECLAWCVERGAVPTEASADEVPADRLQLFPNGKPFLSEDEATEWLNLKTTTLRDARLRREIQPGKMGRSYVYTMRDLLDWYGATKR